MTATKKTAPPLKLVVGGFCFLGAILAGAGTAAGFELSSQSPSPAGVHITAFVDHDKLKPADHFRLNIVVSLDEGWHIYSLESQGDTSLPTRIDLEIRGVLPTGDWQESSPTIVNDQILQRMVKVHLKRAEFRRDFVVEPELGPGHYPINGVLQFRACDNRVCTLPRKIEFSTRISIVTGDRV